MNVTLQRQCQVMLLEAVTVIGTSRAQRRAARAATGPSQPLQHWSTWAHCRLAAMRQQACSENVGFSDCLGTGVSPEPTFGLVVHSHLNHSLSNQRDKLSKQA